MDRRIRYLDRRVDAVKPVGGRASDPGKVFFGARVTPGATRQLVVIEIDHGAADAGV